MPFQLGVGMRLDFIAGNVARQDRDRIEAGIRIVVAESLLQRLRQAAHEGVLHFGLEHSAVPTRSHTLALSAPAARGYIPGTDRSSPASRCRRRGHDPCCGRTSAGNPHRPACARGSARRCRQGKRCRIRDDRTAPRRRALSRPSRRYIRPNWRCSERSSMPQNLRVSQVRVLRMVRSPCQDGAPRRIAVKAHFKMCFAWSDMVSRKRLRCF